MAAERVFAELKRIVAGERPVAGLELMEELGLVAVVLPELGALRGVEQNVFHHRDVHGHTLEVLEAVTRLEAGAPELGEHADAVRELLAEPLADELTRGGGMRFAALLHDAAKPATQGWRPDGRVTFVGHDAEGAQLARDVLRRLRGLAAARRLRRGADPPPPAARLPRPRAPALAPRGLALPQRDRALRGRGHRLHRRRPARHARQERRAGDRRPPRAGARDARPCAGAPRRPEAGAARARARARRASWGSPRAREVGRLLAELEEAQYAGEIRTREDAISLARSLLT